jgi:hypothetical protein
VSHRSKISLVIGADVVAWVAVAVMLAYNPGPDSMGRLPFFLVLEVAVALAIVAVLPWLFSGVLRDLMERYVRDYFAIYCAGYLQREADTSDDPKGPHLVLVPQGQGGGASWLM